jgi:hypothetical protein
LGRKARYGIVSEEQKEEQFLSGKGEVSNVGEVEGEQRPASFLQNKWGTMGLII